MDAPPRLLAKLVVGGGRECKADDKKGGLPRPWGILVVVRPAECKDSGLGPEWGCELAAVDWIVVLGVLCDIYWRPVPRGRILPRWSLLLFAILADPP